MRKAILTLAAVATTATAFTGAYWHHHSLASASVTSSSSGDNHQDHWTCSMHPQVVMDHEGFCPICHMRLVKMTSYGHAPAMDHSDHAMAGPSVVIDPAIIQNMGVRTAMVSFGPLHKSITAVGMLEPPESAQHDVNLRVSGWIEKLYANEEGIHVSKGDVLFDLYSPDLQLAAGELIAAATAARDATDDATKTQAKTMLESSHQKLRQMGIADRDITAVEEMTTPPQTFPIRSPADGHVLDKAVVDGSAVQSGMKVMRIEDHSKLWLDIEVYETDFPFIRLGQTVEATFTALPGETLRGPVAFIYPHLDHMTRTATVRVNLDNVNLALHPGMYAMARIQTQPLDSVVLAPREAIIDTGAKQIAYVAEADGHFSPRLVVVGTPGDDDMLQIVKGLSPGDRVVTSGQFLMDVESRTTEAIEKLRGGNTATDTSAMNGSMQ
jgi:membrane fusion protein, copper/silver efflux system